MTLIEILIGFALVVFCVGYLFLYEAGVILALQDGLSNYQKPDCDTVS
jgi:hypothetical protein